MPALPVLTALLIAPIALASGSQAADKQGYANYSYSQSYNYDFRNSSVVNCIANATKVLTQFGLDKKINTNASEDGKFASVWGWSEDMRMTAEIECNATENESNLVFASYTDNSDSAFQFFERLREAKW